MKRTCDRCGADFEARSGRARFCSSSCRYAARAARAAGRPESVAASVSVVDVDGSGVTGAVRRELDAAGVTGTALGQSALALAALVDASDATRASAAAAAVKELRATLGEALRREAKAADPIDELEERRAARSRS